MNFNTFHPALDWICGDFGHEDAQLVDSTMIWPFSINETVHVPIHQ
jgi:hypothetical protein